MDTNIRDVLEKVAKALAGLQYGQVIIQVTAGKVVFVDVNERIRID